MTILPSASQSQFSRRRFMQAAGAAAVLSRSAFARVPASDRITIGVIGWGMMGPANTKEFLKYADCQVAAACDLEKDALRRCGQYHQHSLRQPGLPLPITTTASCWRATISTP